MANPDKINITNPIRKDVDFGPNKIDTTSKSSDGIDFDNYNIKVEIKSEQPKEVDSTSAKLAKVAAKNNQITARNANGELRFPVQENYYTSFKTDQVVSQVDNSFLGIKATARTRVSTARGSARETNLP